MTADRWVLRIHRQHQRLGEEDKRLAALIAQALADGCSWTVIGRALGKTRQGAHQQWKDRVKNLEAV